MNMRIMRARRYIPYVILVALLAAYAYVAIYMINALSPFFSTS